MSAELSEGTALQPFLLIAKSAKGKGCTAVIEQVLQAPGIFVFGELLDMPNVKQLEGTENKGHFELLKIFAYGTYPTYKERATTLPPLSPQMATKLRQLTIVSLAADNKVIPYTVLLQQLDIPNVRELEDLIIECIYQGVVKGKLDQKQKQLEIDFAIGRDIRPGQLLQMMNVLAAWGTRSDAVISAIDQKIAYTAHAHEQFRKERADFDQRLEALKATLKTSGVDRESDNLLQAADYESNEYLEERSRKRGSKMKGREMLRRI
jgi:COP9 signalosome complex subunit 7